jgi:tetratricopeptide (TPR) repeat protein
MRPLVLALALTCNVVVAQESSLSTLQDLIDRGFWFSAAQVAGPALVEQRPADPEAFRLYALAQYLVGDLQQARENAATAIALRGSASVADRHLAAMIAADSGDSARASAELRTLFAIEPSYRLAMDWGRVAWQAGLLREAADAFEAAASTPGGLRQAWPWLNQGRVLASLGAWEEALDAYRRAISVYELYDLGGPQLPGPEYVEANFRLGEALEALGKPIEAEAAYRAARTADPNHGPSVRALDRLTRRSN